MAERIALEGVALYRRWRIWWIDLHVKGRRLRKSLGTSERAEAIMVAGKVRMAPSKGAGSTNARCHLHRTIPTLPLHHPPSSEKIPYYDSNGLELPATWERKVLCPSGVRSAWSLQY